MAELGPPRMASTVRRFAVPITRRRYPTPATTNGEGLRVYPAPSATTIRAHVFPAGGGTERLPDGGESSDEVEFGTADDIRAADEQTGALADEIVWQGSTYEVDSIDEWQGGATASAEVWREGRAHRVEGRPAVAP